MLDSTTAFEAPEGFRAPPPVPDKVTGNGNGDAIIGPGRGPHRASLSCRFCNVHRGWLNKETAAFFCSRRSNNSAVQPCRSLSRLPLGLIREFGVHNLHQTTEKEESL